MIKTEIRCMGVILFALSGVLLLFPMTQQVELKNLTELDSQTELSGNDLSPGNIFSLSPDSQYKRIGMYGDGTPRIQTQNETEYPSIAVNFLWHPTTFFLQNQSTNITMGWEVVYWDADIFAYTTEIPENPPPCQIYLNGTFLASVSTHIQAEYRYQTVPVAVDNNYNFTVVAEHVLGEKANKSEYFSVQNYPEGTYFEPFIRFDYSRFYTIYTSVGNITLKWDAWDTQWDPDQSPGIKCCEVYINQTLNATIPGRNDKEYKYELPVRRDTNYEVKIVAYDYEGYNVTYMNMIHVDYDVLPDPQEVHSDISFGFGWILCGFVGIGLISRRYKYRVKRVD
ncbi:MAG: hypothetical protein ACTSWW_06620 [Promethearchaeota archaeon]